jgi:hypothetical protein
MFDAKPKAFLTQPIECIEDFGEIIDIAHSHNILMVAYIMVPSKNNQTSEEGQKYGNTTAALTVVLLRKQEQ